MFRSKLSSRTIYHINK